MKKNVRPKILVNASTLVVGGGAQVGFSFIEVAVSRDDFDFLFLVSPLIYKMLPADIRARNDIVCIEQCPSPLFSGMRSRAGILEIEKKFAPDLVYSIGFPSYIRFTAPEIGRYTNPMEILPPPLPWKVHGGLWARLLIYLGVLYRQFWARRAAYLETQTQLAKRGLVARINYSPERVRIFPNSANDIFVKEGSDIADVGLYVRGKKENIVFCLSAAYRHKNMSLVPYVARELVNGNGLDVKFLLTLPFDSEIWRQVEGDAHKLGVSENVINCGPLELKECVAYFKKSSVVFLPTLLEVFSATYLEAMWMRVPIVTSDREFAREVCGEGAAYFDPESPKEAAERLTSLLMNADPCIELVDKALEVLRRYPTNEQKYDDLFSWLHELSSVSRGARAG